MPCAARSTAPAEIGDVLRKRAGSGSRSYTLWLYDGSHTFHYRLRA